MEGLENITFAKGEYKPTESEKKNYISANEYFISALKKKDLKKTKLNKFMVRVYAFITDPIRETEKYYYGRFTPIHYTLVGEYDYQFTVGKFYPCKELEFIPKQTVFFHNKENIPTITKYPTFVSLWYKITQDEDNNIKLYFRKCELIEKDSQQYSEIQQLRTLYKKQKADSFKILQRLYYDSEELIEDKEELMEAFKEYNFEFKIKEY